jgi:hypothetical protein
MKGDTLAFVLLALAILLWVPLEEILNFLILYMGIVALAIWAVTARLGPTSIAEREAADERAEEAEEAAERAGEGAREGGRNRRRGGRN